MFRLFLALNFLLLNTFACKGGYESCKLKIIHSKAIVNQSLQIPVLNNQRLIFSPYLPNAKVIKHDPFLSLYLVKSRKKFKHPFKINNHLSLGVASVDEKRAVEGRIVKKQTGLNSFATFSEALYAPALLLNSCCGLEGIVTSKGIIEKIFVERFLKGKSSDYGDVGIRVEDKKGIVLVKKVNPFVKDNQFKKDDCIVGFDGKEIKDSATLMRKILFSKVDSYHIVRVKRGSKYLNLKVQAKKRYGGGYISDTFLEQIGFYFTQDLCISRIADGFETYGLKVGDRLIQVNGKGVSNIDAISDNISNFKHFASLLFERNQFQFFVNIKGNVKSVKN